MPERDDLTGMGILSTMLALPLASVWNWAHITEALTVASNTRPATFPTPRAGLGRRRRAVVRQKGIIDEVGGFFPAGQGSQVES